MVVDSGLQLSVSCYPLPYSTLTTFTCFFLGSPDVRTNNPRTGKP